MGCCLETTNSAKSKANRHYKQSEAIGDIEEYDVDERQFKSGIANENA